MSPTVIRYSAAIAFVVAAAAIAVTALTAAGAATAVVINAAEAFAFAVTRIISGARAANSALSASLACSNL